MRLLVIEDERELAHLIRRGLTEHGYAVDVAYDGDEGEMLAESVPYDLIVLDIMLPKKNGFDVCRSLRRAGVSSRILMLTARDKVEDRINGLDCGADDYLVKPFDFGELYARLRSLLRREVRHVSPLLQVRDLSLDTVGRRAIRRGRDIALTRKEYALLEYLIHYPGIVVTRRMIEEHVWNLSLDSDSNVIEVHVNRLRAKLNANGEEDLIETVRGSGYRMVEK